jgi:hypothetical protein
MDWELAKEATEVGVLLVPVYAIVREALNGLRFKNERNKEYISVFIGGALFHILAEATGVNEWYLTNSRANKQSIERRLNGERVPHSSDGRVCSLALWARQNKRS